MAHVRGSLIFSDCGYRAKHWSAPPKITIISIWNGAEQKRESWWINHSITIKVILIGSSHYDSLWFIHLLIAHLRTMVKSLQVIQQETIGWVCGPGSQTLEGNQPNHRPLFFWWKTFPGFQIAIPRNLSCKIRFNSIVDVNQEHSRV